MHHFACAKRIDVVKKKIEISSGFYLEQLYTWIFNGAKLSHDFVPCSVSE